MLYAVPRLLLHVSRPVRWDSDHVVLPDDETRAIASEIVRHNLFDRVHIGLISSTPLSTVSPRGLSRPKTAARPLEPTDQSRQCQFSGSQRRHYTARLALLEEQALPWQAVQMCGIASVTPRRLAASGDVRAYEKRSEQNVADSDT